MPNTHSSIFRQDSSWSHFNISKEMFCMIASYIDIFPSFLPFLQAFGFKLGEEDKDFGGWQQRIKKRKEHNKSELDFGNSTLGGASVGEFTNNVKEIVYNIRYVDKHHRQLQNPWSIRQTGVYQSYVSKTKCSVSIVLQPSERAYCRIRDEMMREVHLACDIASVFGIHSIIIQNTQQNWRQYINYLQKELLVLVGKRPNYDKLKCVK
jgi:hypothetical protein